MKRSLDTIITKLINGQRRFSPLKIWYFMRFKNFSLSSYIQRPTTLFHPEQISIGKRVRIRRNSRMDVGMEGQIIFQDDVFIEDYFHVSAINSVTIGEGTLIGSKVHITDHNHTVTSEPIPIKYTPVKTKGPTNIGCFCWIGDNCVIISATIGDNCIIGANSVVIGDIPANSLAVGSPAKVVKRYDNKRSGWRSSKPTNPEMKKTNNT